MSNKLDNKLTKNVSNAQEIEREICNFTKPFKTKEQWVCIVHNKTHDTYEIRGIDCFGCFIRSTRFTYAEAEAEFYRELCWILNEIVMCDTAEQRANPSEAYLNN